MKVAIDFDKTLTRLDVQVNSPSYKKKIKKILGL